MFKKNKPPVGYKKTSKKKTKTPKKHIMHEFLVSNNSKKISFTEKFIKLIIYVSLRLVIRPKKWKHPEKNIEIINRTYKRIMSNDFVYIPSSIAFYLIMAFMPVLSLIAIFYMIPGTDEFSRSLSTNGKDDAISEVLGKFIPGASSIFEQIKQTVSNTSARTSASILTTISILISTWIAANGFSKLIYTQSYIYEHKYLGGYWMNKFKGMVMVIAFTLFLLISLFINMLFSGWLSTIDVSHDFKKIILHLYLIVGLFIGLFIGFTVLYKFSPRFKIKVRHVIPGAMVSTVPTTSFLVFFGSISSYWSYGSYGVIGAIMYIGTASLTITYFIFVGISANEAYYKTFVHERVKSKWTLSRK